MSKNNILSRTLISWFSSHARDLPWRNTRNPYYIWLSEVILQQTRVAQGMPYFLRFLEEYPQITDMAKASERDILRLWQGLGYYSRARNMHATAQYIANELGGNFPDNYKDLLKLKGVGHYTAAAIASFAFNEKVAVLDGNVFRVLARYWGVDTDIASPEGHKVFSKLAAECLPEQEIDTYNQAIMEFGAIQCTPASPQCMFCPLNTSCAAFETRQQQNLPVKIKKVKVRERFLNYLVLRIGQNTLMRERKGKGIWQGLYEFWCVESDKALSVEEVLQHEAVAIYLQDIQVQIGAELPPHKHILTHQILQVRFWEINTSDTQILQKLEPQGFALYTPEQAAELPKPILIANYLDK